MTASFGILGNHDGDLLAPWLARLGVTGIEDRHVRLGAPGEQVDLIGLPGVGREAEPAFYDRERDPAVPAIVLSHYPDAIHRLGRLRPDVVLAGHTHGGQISLPGRVPLVTHDSLPRHMAAGVHETENGVLVVSRGLGHTVVPVRLFAPPQLIEVVLERQT
jgi:predicted MPP superfamily phosphohydrolase